MDWDRLLKFGFVACALALVVVGIRISGSDAKDAAILVAKREAYRQDVQNWHQLIDGCETTKGERARVAAANERAWIAARKARRLTRDDPAQKEDARRVAGDAVEVYTETITELGALVDAAKGRNCQAAFLKPVPPDGVAALP